MDIYTIHYTLYTYRTYATSVQACVRACVRACMRASLIQHSTVQYSTVQYLLYSFTISPAPHAWNYERVIYPVIPHMVNGHMVIWVIIYIFIYFTHPHSHTHTNNISYFPFPFPFSSLSLARPSFIVCLCLSGTANGHPEGCLGSDGKYDVCDIYMRHI